MMLKDPVKTWPIGLSYEICGKLCKGNAGLEIHAQINNRQRSTAKEQ